MRELTSQRCRRPVTARISGRRGLVHDMYLVEVRRPGESPDLWNLEKVQDVMAGNEVFRPDE